MGELEPKIPSKSSEIEIKSNTFQYFDDNFYDFLKSSSRGKTNKKIRFRNKTTKILTPNDAFLLKTFIDTRDFKYKNPKLKQLLNHPNIIQTILNDLRNIKIYK